VASTNDEAETEAFRRVLSLPQVTMSGVAVIVGAGIFVLLGPATEEAGGAVWLAFVIAGVLSGFTAFSYMELASMYPRASSEHEFTRQALPRWVGAVVGWCMALALVVAAAAVSLGFARYWNEFFDMEPHVVGAVVLVISAAATYFGMEKAVWLILGLAVVEVGALLVIIAMGVPSIGDHNLLDGTVTGVVGAAALVFFAFIGFDEVITLAEETKDPARTVPRALLWALGISTLLYVAVAIAAVSVLGAADLAAAARPLAAVGEATLGTSAAKALSVAALFSTGSTVLLVITAASRMLYGIAAAGDLPRSLAVVRMQRVPLNSLLLSVVVAVGLVFFADLKALASATDALIYLIFLVVNVVVVILRFTKPHIERPFRIRGAVGRVPLLPVVGFVVVLIVSRELEASSFGLAGVIVGVGGLVHVVHRVRERRERMK
jgi:APA family basic amino acid/polyamine antiporter